ncbi:MAG: hypothetical protein IT379_36215 [Deltaproteobacteria bacterium]|nr:hypothetical protein [Deltaproteobacteria bacterium]
MQRHRRFGWALAALLLTGCATELESKDPTTAVDDAELSTIGEDSADSATRPTILGSLANGESAEGDFSTRARYLAWTFDAQAGQTAHIDAGGATNPDLDTVLFLYRANAAGRPTGRALAWNDDYEGTLASHVDHELTETRTYVLVVRRYDYGTRGRVRVKLGLTGGEQACGSRGLGPCPEGQFCNHPISAICGWADGPGVCTTPPDACIDLYAPVCGCDGNTYGNSCYAALAGVSVQREGACERACGGLLGLTCEEGEFCDYEPGQHCGAADQTGVCRTPPTACTREFRPVCGCNGQTYSNACNARAAGTGVLSEGECDAPPRDCRTTGCGAGQYCTYCWVNYACIPEGAVC